MFEQRQRFFPVPRGQGLVSFALQDFRQPVADMGIVFGDEHFHRTSPSGTTGQRSVSRNVAPTSLGTSTKSPPCKTSQFARDGKTDPGARYAVGQAIADAIKRLEDAIAFGLGNAGAGVRNRDAHGITVLTGLDV